MKKIEPLDIMRYYVTYRDTEKQILADIDSTNTILRENAYKKYVNQHMKIGRNFKSDTVHMVLAETKNYNGLGKVDIYELSKIYASKGLLNNRINNAIVAASKLLWLFNQEVIIMDNLNMKILKAKDYTSYISKWYKQFEIKEQEIIEVIDLYFKNIDSVMDQKWFRMRVFDQYLLTQKNA